ncbi:glycosyl hydrolase [Massilioclostridium coli]|uniref:glycosyl hydrolase n=1 Tax=Massilioclostridium coli TaxID=1870991 RepID=UPI0022E186EB|nr:glycosyl hydrolase [Massilioclostridium coli]
MKKRTRVLSALLAAALTGSVVGANLPVFATDDSVTATVVDSFKDPSSEAKPMARFWFPDAGAGLPDSDYKNMVGDLIRQLADGGFGGVEITMLADSNSYDNDTAAEIGWGSDAWAEVLSQAVYAANQIEGGFRVDVTITAHWPPVINSIDPNDDQQQQELTYVVQKLTNADLSDTTIDLDLPEMKTQDFSNTQNLIATFLFQDKIVSSAIAKVASVDENGNPVIDYDSLTELNTSVKPDTGYAVGIPEQGVSALKQDKSGAMVAVTPGENGYMLLDEQTVIWKTGENKGKIIEGAIVEIENAGMPWASTKVTLNGEDITSQATIFDKGTLVQYDEATDTYSNEGLVAVVNNDTFGDRERMADWQDIYQVNESDLSAEAVEAIQNSSDDTIQAGDYVLVNTYRRGTGQIMSGGQTITMPNRTYAVDYFNEEGIQEVIDYWNENMLPHVSPDCGGKSLAELMKINGGSIFEDSIEIHRTGSIWTANMLEDFEASQGYDVGKYAGVIAGVSTNKADEAERVTEDYNLVLGELYSSDHADKIMEWTKSFGYTYRAQAYTLSGLDVAGAANAIDIPEGDNSTAGDGIRNLASAANVGDKEFLSMEALTSASDHPVWYEALREINMNLSDGINRIILHGIPFTKSYTDVNNEWPGWTFMSYGCWAPRQPFWEDMDLMSNYFARIQSVTQEGTVKIPVAIMNDKTKSFQCLNGTMFPTLLNNGYTYNILSEAVLEDEGAIAENGVLCPDTAGYQVLVLKEVNSMSCETLEKIIGFANAGVKIVSYNSNPTSVYGTEKADNSDAKLQELYAKLQTNANFKAVTTEEELLAYLDSCDIETGASYDQEGLEVTHVKDSADDTNYYFFFNEHNIGEDPSGGMGIGSDFSKADYQPIETTVTLEGEGTPYMLDPISGEITPISDYSVTEDGKIEMTLSLEALNTTILAVTSNTEDFPDPSTAPAEKTYTDSIDLSNEKWNLDIQSWGPDASVNDYDPSQSTKTEITAGEINLDLWKNLTINEEELAKAGVESSGQLSGIGTYSIDVTMPDDWDTDNMGAEFTFEHKGLVQSGGGFPGGPGSGSGETKEIMETNQDMITAVTVTNENGTFTIRDINPLNEFVDLGKVLTAGKNTISVKLTTTLENREDGKATANYDLTKAGLNLYEQKSTVDKGILNSVIEYADAAKASGEYDNAIESVQKSFDEALTNAKSVAENGTATQEEVDAAWKTLLNEIHKLGFVAGDKTELASLIAAAEGIDLSKYVEAGQAEFTAALEAAKGVFEDGDAMQAEINEVADKLLNAMLNLRYKADKSILEEVVAKANQIDANAYTAESYAVLEATLKDADAVLANENATQEEVDTAVENVQSAMDGLVAVEGTETPSDNNATQTGQESTTTKANAAKTGDFTPIAGMAVLAVAGAAVLITRKKK